VKRHTFQVLGSDAQARLTDVGAGQPTLICEVTQSWLKKTRPVGRRKIKQRLGVRLSEA
jgi:hypothetical protein